MAYSRKSFVRKSVAAAAALSLSPFVKAENKTANKKLKVVCIGGHPDDPETICGGTLALFSGAGHEVTIIYLTRGEAGIEGKSHQQASAIRTKEAVAACKLLNAKPVFAGQTDGESIVNNEWQKKIQELINVEKPDIVFTHWPIDNHKDHQAASLLTIQAWLHLNKSFKLYLAEACTGSQTMRFKPTEYVDITTTRELKKKAVYCHISQEPDTLYASSFCNHELIEKFRGLEMNTVAAEAFVKMEQTQNWFG